MTLRLVRDTNPPASSAPAISSGRGPTLRTYDEAVRWLREAADELTEVPLRLHSIGQEGVLGPPYSGAFLHYLSTSTFSVKEVTAREFCPRPHPVDAICDLCHNTYSFDVTRLRYQRPLAAALARLENVPATSRAWPKQHTMILALIAAGFRLDGAARAIGHPITSHDERVTVEAAFVLAIRRLHDRYRAGPEHKWTALSSSQQAAIIDGENAA